MARWRLLPGPAGRVAPPRRWRAPARDAGAALASPARPRPRRSAAYDVSVVRPRSPDPLWHAGGRAHRFLVRRLGDRPAGSAGPAPAGPSPAGRPPLRAHLRGAGRPPERHGPSGTSRSPPTADAEPLHYAGIYEGGQVVACTAGGYEALSRGLPGGGPGRPAQRQLRDLHPGVAASTPSSAPSTRPVGRPDNDWSGRCAGGWCTTARARPRGTQCDGKAGHDRGSGEPPRARTSSSEPPGTT